MKGIYKFSWNCGRQGDVEGCFVATEESVKEATGKDVYFGEILGKHSDVYGTLEESEIKLITTDPSAVALFEKYDLNSGYNPLEYLDEEDGEGE